MNAQHPAIQELLSYFRYDHLPPSLQAISEPYHVLAHKMASETVLSGPQVRDGLFLLLQSKDCMVRAALPKPDQDGI